MTHTTIFDLIGRTPTVRVRVPGHDHTFLKLEGTNPTGSIKDRSCAFMLKAAIDDGSLLPGQVVLDASSGNFACALALYGKVLGYSAEVVVNSKLTAAKREFLRYLGATIRDVGQFTYEGNEYCRTLHARNPGRYCFVDQLHNWRNPQAHRETTGPEILEACPDVEMIVGSLGSGGSMFGTAEHVKAVAPHVKIVVVECATGNRIPGTGTFVDGDCATPFIRKGYDEGYFDATVHVTEDDARRTAGLLIEQGIFCGLQTGGVVHAASRAAATHRIKGPIVAISGDTGWKNLDKLMVSTALAASPAA